jgi:hypothetical protein
MKRILFSSNTALVWASGAALCAALAGASPAAADTDTSPPQAALGGYRDRVAGPLDLSLLANDGGSGLARAAAAIDGVVVVSVPLCPNPSAGCPGLLTNIQLPIDSTQFADGPHHLLVTVTDAAGNTTPIDKDIDVVNTPPDQSSSATLTIGSGNANTNGTTQQGDSNGGVKDASGTSTCNAPKLSMFLSQKPLRVTKGGRAVLAKGKRYRFTGRLTCVVKGKRVSAPSSTRIDVANVLAGKRVGKGGATVRAKGKITLILAYSSSRTIEFSYRSATGRLSRVRINVQVVHVNKKGGGGR